MRLYPRNNLRDLSDSRRLESNGSTRCLQKFYLYRADRAGWESNISFLIDQAHDRLLEQTQLPIGWAEVWKKL